MFGEEEIVKQHKSRADLLGNIVVFSFAIILARLWFLQIYKGNVLYDYSLRNRLRKELVRAPRGMIYSRDDQMLVDNIPRFDAVLVPQFLKSKKNTLKHLAEFLDMNIDDINQKISSNRGQASYKPIIIKKNISHKEVARIETENYLVPGVSVDTFISREYIDQQVGAHLLGYISEISKDQLPRYQKRDNYDYKAGDYIGNGGIEEQFDPILRGENGFEFVEVDALGRKKKHINTDNLFQGIRNQKSIPGKNIKLTVDRDLQLVAYEALKDKVGSAVAINVNTGEILAMVSTPSFDPSTFNRKLTSDYWSELMNNTNRPMRDKTIQAHYPPGSTFKVFTAIAALEEGIVNAKTTVKCTGRFRFGRRRYHCWRRWGHGEVDAVKAIRESCDVYFYKIATKLDIDVLARYAKLFGFGKKTGIQLPREIPGLIPTKEWKEKRDGIPWQKGETLSCVIGQSYMLSTPLQLAVAFATFANGGKHYKPLLIKEVFDNFGKTIETTKSEVVDEIKLKPETIELIKKGLYEVVNSPKGTVWWRRGSGNQMSGKTGTAQVIRMSAEKLFAKCDEKDFENRHHALFVGYAPTENPEIAVSAVVEHGCSGGRVAAPVVEKIVSAYMKKYRPKLQKKYAAKEKKEFNSFLAQRRRVKEEAKKKEEEKEEEEEEEGNPLLETEE